MTTNHHEILDELRDAWDARPRGPGMFIATYQGDRPLHGHWVTPDHAEAYYFDELDAVSNLHPRQRDRRHWRAIRNDHDGPGTPMGLAELHDRLRRLQGGQP